MERLSLTETTTDNEGFTAVSIYGRTYHLRGEGNPAYLERLAAFVDRKMRDIADSTGTADTLKVAILTALNLADENLQADGGGLSEGNEAMRKRIGKVVTMLDEAIAG
jgi:cell division protein ZapA